MTTPPWRPRLLAPGLDDRTARRATLLSAATAAGASFAAIGYQPLKLVTVSATVAVLLLVAGAVTAVGARLRRPVLVAATGSVLVVIGLFRLATYGHGSALIGGASSTAALLTALGVAHLGVLAAGTAAGPAAGPADDPGAAR
jgi:uncharacterized oligopeptide transporter (OPT) family protein